MATSMGCQELVNSPGEPICFESRLLSSHIDHEIWIKRVKGEYCVHNERAGGF